MKAIGKSPLKVSRCHCGELVYTEFDIHTLLAAQVVRSGYGAPCKMGEGGTVRKLETDEFCSNVISINLYLGEG